MSERASATASASGGTSFSGLLTVAFIVLKLTGVIDWSWVWVLAPLWIGLAFLVVILFVVGVVFLVIWLRDRR